MHLILVLQERASVSSKERGNSKSQQNIRSQWLPSEVELEVLKLLFICKMTVECSQLLLQFWYNFLWLQTMIQVNNLPLGKM